MNLGDGFNRLFVEMPLLRQRLADVFRDPRAYPRETMLVALIAAVLVLVLVLGVVAIHGYIVERRQHRRIRVRRRVRNILGRWAMVFTGVVIAGGVFALLPAVPGTERACGLCHATNAAMRSWAAGEHSSVGCYGCHARGGVMGAAETSLRGVSSLLGVTTRRPVASADCARCHEDIEGGVLVADGIRIQHSHIIDSGTGCLMCHEDAGHSSVAETTTADGVTKGTLGPRSVMARCMTCHDGRTAGAECAMCHVEGSPHDQSDDPGPAGDTLVPVRCNACHSEAVQRRCTACHGIEMPHPKTFRRRHAGLSAENPGLCARCHEIASPTDACACHTEVNEHGTYSEWFPVHGRAGGPGGCRCHERSFCAYCHESDPAW